MFAFFKTNFIFVFLCLLFLLGVNITLFFIIIKHNNVIGFNHEVYQYGAHHFFSDPRADGGKFEFFRALGQFDGQWYLKIANLGYPKNQTLRESLSYAFAPLFPILVWVITLITQNSEKSAFIINNTLLFINFLSLVFVVSKLFSLKIAYKTAFLLFLFPTSIFYRSYFSEGIFLFLFIWFSYFLIKKNFLLSGFFLGLLFVSRFSGFLLEIVFLYYLFKEALNKQITIKKMFLPVFLSILPFSLWLMYSYIQTGNPLIFHLAQSQWFPIKIPFIPLLANIATVFWFPVLPFHSFNFSQIDIFFIITVGMLLFKSRSILPKQLWWSAFLLWLTPLLVKDLMSTTRFVIVQFPLFIYLAIKLNPTPFVIVSAIFFFGLQWVSLYFVNWYWIG